MKQLQIRDLSVGDWVQDKESGQPMRIVALDKSGWVLCEKGAEDNDSIEFFIDDLQGVEITADILLKNGFEKRTAYYTCRLSPYEMIWFGLDARYGHRITAAHYADDVKVKYVHEVQHTLRVAHIEKDISLWQH